MLSKSLFGSHNLFTRAIICRPANSGQKGGEGKEHAAKNKGMLKMEIITWKFSYFAGVSGQPLLPCETEEKHLQFLHKFVSVFVPCIVDAEQIPVDLKIEPIFPTCKEAIHVAARNQFVQKLPV